MISVLTIVLAAACTGKDPKATSVTQRKRIQVNHNTLQADDSFAPIEPLWWTVDIYNGPAEYEASLEAFTHSQRLLHAIHCYRSEVNNGGHDQFYFNSTGIVWRDALNGTMLTFMRNHAQEFEFDGVVEIPQSP